MKQEIVLRLNKTFEETAFVKDGTEYWMARDIQILLEYEKWENFVKVIEKAKTACANSKQTVENHFLEVRKMVKIGSETQREINDFMLTRYACYLIAQNGDPRKDTVAFAQSYFALQTRKQELLEQRIELIERLTARGKLTATETELSRNLYQRGVDNQGFARIRSKGDQALFGQTTLDMKRKLDVPENRPLADFLPTITIKAKDLAAEITNHNVKRDDIKGEPNISSEHVKNNQDVRGLLAKSGIKPEALPAAEDIKKLERRVKADEKKMLKNAKKD